MKILGARTSVWPLEVTQGYFSVCETWGRKNLIFKAKLNLLSTSLWKPARVWHHEPNIQAFYKCEGSAHLTVLEAWWSVVERKGPESGSRTLALAWFWVVILHHCKNSRQCNCAWNECGQGHSVAGAGSERCNDFMNPVLKRTRLPRH